MAMISMTHGSESASRLVPLTVMVGLGQINQPYLHRTTVPQLYLDNHHMYMTRQHAVLV